MVLEEKERNSKLTEETFEKINDLGKKVGTNKLVFRYKDKTPGEDFSKFNNALDLTSKIRNGKISLIKAIDEQAKLKSDMGEIKIV